MNLASWRTEVRRLGMLRVDLRRWLRVLYIEDLWSDEWMARSARVVG